MSFSDINLSKQFYCVDCGKSLRKFTSKEDWITRKKHQKCWKKFNQYGFSDYRLNFLTGEKIP